MRDCLIAASNAADLRASTGVPMKSVKSASNVMEVDMVSSPTLQVVNRVQPLSDVEVGALDSNSLERQGGEYGEHTRFEEAVGATDSNCCSEQTVRGVHTRSEVLVPVAVSYSLGEHVR